LDKPTPVALNERIRKGNFPNLETSELILHSVGEGFIPAPNIGRVDIKSTPALREPASE